MYGILAYLHTGDSESEGLEGAERSNILAMITFEMDILCKVVLTTY